MASLLKANLMTVAPRVRVTAITSIRTSRVRIGEFELDSKSGELRRGAKRVVLQNQPHKILLMLIERPGQFVTREEIQEQLWPPDVIVSFEVGINQAVRKLRKNLNDSAAKPRYIETVGRRGYRLLVPVEATEAADEATVGMTDDPVRKLVAGATGYRADELQAIADGLIKLLPLLISLKVTDRAKPDAQPTLVARLPQVM